MRSGRMGWNLMSDGNNSMECTYNRKEFLHPQGYGVASVRVDHAPANIAPDHVIVFGPGKSIAGLSPHS